MPIKSCVGMGAFQSSPIPSAEAGLALPLGPYAVCRQTA